MSWLEPTTLDWVVEPTMRIMIKSYDVDVDFPLTCGRREGALGAFGKGQPH